MRKSASMPVGVRYSALRKKYRVNSKQNNDGRKEVRRNRKKKEGVKSLSFLPIVCQ